MGYPQVLKISLWLLGELVHVNNLRRWQDYCHDNDVDVFQPELNRAIEVFVSLYHYGLRYSAVNNAHSAPSSIIILDNGLKFGEKPLVCRCLKGYLNSNQLSLSIQRSGTLTLYLATLRSY